LGKTGTTCWWDRNSICTLDFAHVSEEMDRCVVRKKAEFGTAPVTNCLPVATFVTSYARLHLYWYMQQVNNIGGQLLYCDTDSIIYVARQGGERVGEGEALGQMKRDSNTANSGVCCGGGGAPRTTAIVTWMQQQEVMRELS